MKICGKCSAQQSDSRFLCVDCGAKLGNPVSKSEAERVKQETQAKLDNLIDMPKYIKVSKNDKIIGVASLAGMAVGIIISAIFKRESQYAVLAAVFFPMCAAYALMPNIIWSIQEAFIGFGFNRFSLRYYIHKNDDTVLFDIFKWSRKFGIYFGFIVCVLCLAAHIIIK